MVEVLGISLRPPSVDTSLRGQSVPTETPPPRVTEEEGSSTRLPDVPSALQVASASAETSVMSSHEGSGRVVTRNSQCTVGVAPAIWGNGEERRRWQRAIEAADDSASDSGSEGWEKRSDYGTFDTTFGPDYSD